MITSFIIHFNNATNCGGSSFKKVAKFLGVNGSLIAIHVEAKIFEAADDEAIKAP